MGDVWISTIPVPGGGFRTVYAPVAGTPAPLTADVRGLDRDQLAAMVRDLSGWLEVDADPTSRRLARALREAGAPPGMVADALAGRYADETSDLEFPVLKLLEDLEQAGMARFVDRVEAGEFDPPPPVRLAAVA